MLNIRFLPVLMLLLAAVSAPPAQGKLFDGGVDSANLGKGDWIYYLSACYNGMNGNVPSVHDAQSLFEWEKSQGMSFVAVKAGTGSTNYAEPGKPIQFTSALVDAAHNAGLKIFGYTRSYGSDIVGESAIADYVYNCGADGFIFDAEAEWESSRSWIGTNGPMLAWQMCGMVKSNWPTKFLAHAPMPIINYHKSFPYKEFGYWCDAVMPQDYWVSFADAGYGTPTLTIQWMDSNWSTFQNSLVGLTPLGTSWTNAIKPLAPAGQADAAGQTAAEMLEFVSYLRTDPNCVTRGGYKGCSFWRADLHTPEMWEGIRFGYIGNYAPVVTNQPQGQTMLIGQSVTFSVTAGGSPAPAYQWRFNGTNLAGATRSFLTRANLQLSDAGSYSVRLTNSMGTNFTADAVLAVIATPTPPSIAVQPQSITIGTGNSAAFFVVATGLTPLTYQWRYNGSPISGATNSSFSGAVNAGSYSVLVTNRIGSTTSSVATLTVLDDIIIDNVDAGFTFTGSWILTSYSTVRIGDNYRYATSASSATALATYTPNIPVTGCYDVEVFYSSGSNRSTAAPYSVVSSGGTATAVINQTTGGGIWQTVATGRLFSAGTGGYLRINNNTGETGKSIMADAARFRFSAIQPPVIVGPPQTQTVRLGGAASFNVYVSGASLSYQWRLNGSNIAGATGSSYILTSAQVTNAGLYSVVVSNPAGNATSSSAGLTVGSSYVELDLNSLGTNGVSIEVGGEPGNYLVEKSGNLITWLPLTNVAVFSNSVQVLDPISSTPRKYYRAKSWP